ncbi:DUF305 domain-containing protein [Streptomyces asoensis]|uniref:Lipoprotein n=1 Tax=Streptomyces asoensis TaxID=249586 RepID=A0ABQ3S907_9ACTN|nr:DUF305 domain-containing protein [Streptomyces asoensis]GGQ72339.1 lipoprotein [Streptomyces asoensis]GHI64589.1 lipoprotein [Streptomyces asoensis]
MRNTRTLTRRALVGAASVTAALVLAACGSGGESTGEAGGGSGSAPASTGASADATAGAHNAQDVAFAQGMIPHHRQALEMARLAAGRASSAQVKDIAARVEKAQDPEIKTMSGWLTAWGEDVPAASGSAAESMPGMDHSAGSGMPGMPGMMDASGMDALKKASGAEFDTMFLTMMIEHHKGAVEMAGTEKDKGAYRPAASMADAIVTSQTAEITEMTKLLDKS